MGGSLDEIVAEMRRVLDDASLDEIVRDGVRVNAGDLSCVLHVLHVLRFGDEHVISAQTRPVEEEVTP